MQNSIPKIARQVTDLFAPAFTPRTHSRFVLLLLGAILTLGCRTVSNILRLLGRLAPGHPTSYHRLVSPAKVRLLRRRRLSVTWYGGTTRRVEVVSGTGHWYKSGQELVPVRWVWVRDLTGTPQEEYFFTTDVGQSGRRGF